MDKHQANHAAVHFRSKCSLFFAIIMIILSVITLAGCRTGSSVAASTGETTLSRSELEDQYGLRVSLVAVTAAGGFVDVRLKMTDPEKAKSLLQDPKNYPVLWVADGGVLLNAPDDTKAQEINYQKDGNLYLLFPNAGNAVKPGKPVSIRFGQIQVEPINSN